MTAAGLHFAQAKLVRPEDYPAFDQAIRALGAITRVTVGRACYLGMSLIGAWTLTAETIYGGAAKSWYAATIVTDQGSRLSMVGLWYHTIAVPILQFFWYRWIWRFIIWIRFLYDVSRLNLDLVPTHADGAGGLGFLGTAHTAFGIISIRREQRDECSSGVRHYFRCARSMPFKIHFIVLIVVTEVLIFGPLIMFCPTLIRFRQAWLRQYSLLVLRYNRAFHEKWVEGKAPEGEPLLGSTDIQSLADLGNSYEFIRQMKVVPLSVRVILQLAVVTLIPALPLVLLVIPIEDILDIMTKAVL